MSIKDTLEKSAKQVIINKVVDYLDKNPERNVDKIFDTIKTITKDEHSLEQINFVQNYYKTNKPTYDFIQNILTNRSLCSTICSSIREIRTSSIRLATVGRHLAGFSRQRTRASLGKRLGN